MLEKYFDIIKKDKRLKLVSIVDKKFIKKYRFFMIIKK